MNRHVLRAFCRFPALSDTAWPLLPPSYRKDHVRRALLTIVRRGDVCFEVGANVGQYTPFLSCLVGPRGKVVAFEPIERNLTPLRERLRSLGTSDNVEVEPIALGSERGMVDMFVPGDAGSMASLRRHENVCWEPFAEVSKVTAKVDTLDDYVRDKGITKLDVLKVDIEGAESLFLTGAATTIKKLRPTILMEIDPVMARTFGQTPKETIGAICTMGYAAPSRISDGDYVFRSHGRHGYSN